jgi:CRISPR-associated endonuclease/helicase Cas3
MLLDSDKHEVSVGFFLNRKYLPFDMIETYRTEKGFDKPKKQIHILRNEIYQRVISQTNNIDINKEHIFSLSAPTGSGKTLTALGFAIKLRERIFNKKGYCPRIIYSLPFLSIIDQNANVIEEAFQSTLKRKPTSGLFLVHHHLSDYTYREENAEYDAQNSEILVEGWDSEIIITTFVQLFHALFSNQNSAIRKFHKVAGSIIVLDEIQSFPPRYWLLFKKMAESMGKYLNTYFILSTATQPAIFDVPKELLPNKKKYFESFRRNRLAVEIATPKSVSEFTKKFIGEQKGEPKNTLIILNTVNCAEELYKIVKKELKNDGFKIFYLSSHIVPVERLERIRKIKQTKQKKIVISTQLVEAGVDIDLEKVIKDLGPLDSVIQAAGRANREFNINLGEVEVILLKDEKSNRPFYSYIYTPVLIDATRETIKYSLSINEDRLLKLCNNYYQEVRNKISGNLSYKYLEAIKNLDYEEVKSYFFWKNCYSRDILFLGV